MFRIVNLTYRLGARLLFENASVTAPTGARVGLVGRNGTGKTTLFRLMLGEIGPETGDVILPRAARLGTVAQEAPSGPDSLLSVVLAADRERAALLEEAETATDPTRIADIQTRLVDIDAHSAPARAAGILHGLGFDAEQQAKPCSDFSGGWRMRVALAAVLFSEPDFLMLDEPTNYLDLEGALWLQDYLSKYRHTLLVISHDRDFLDAVTDHTIHLKNATLTLYKGGVSSFERQYAERQTLLAKQAEKIEAERKHLQAFVDRFKAKASKATQAQSRVKRLAKLQTIKVDAGEDDAPIRLPDPVKPLASPLVAFEAAAVGYGERMVLKNLSMTIAEDDRIGLLGANGNGKSTLVKLISGRLPAMAGSVRRSDRLNVAYFAQHQMDELPDGETPVAMVRRMMPDVPEAKVRARTAQLGFPFAKADTRISSLSGGEKARLLLGLAAFHGPHILILDEPTNHLDMQSRTALIEAISSYKGAVVIVSHDRFLLDTVCDRLWLVKNGTVKPFDGDIDDYARMVTTGETAAPRQLKPVADHGDAGRLRRDDVQPLRKKLMAVEADMAKLSGLIARIDAALADPSIFQDTAHKASKLAADRAALAARLAALEDNWLDASQAYDAATGRAARSA